MKILKYILSLALLVILSVSAFTEAKSYCKRNSRWSYYCNYWKNCYSYANKDWSKYYHCPKNWVYKRYTPAR